ncbi:MAG: tRNA lysidine(34) synthetase TilS [Anaerolineae bacterium]
MNPATSVLHTLREHDLLPADALLIVGVSGGTDSLALLHILRRLGVRLHVATLDHGLRGAAGAADARFVVETAEAWGLPVTAGRADVRVLAKAQRLSIEAAARAARYDFLSSVAHEAGTQRIAVAHNADDQVETVLLHLLRGSGVGGLAGMAYAAPLPGHPDLMLIRPLLDVPRAALDAYCREHGLQPRHDASNADARYRRNRLRLDLDPEAARSLAAGRAAAAPAWRDRSR